MPNLTLGNLKAPMIESFKGVIGEGWPKVKDFAATELKLLAQSLVEIQKLAVAGKIKKAEAKSLMRQHRNTTIAVMAGIEGMTLLVAEQAVNAALGAVRDVVNTAAGFRIL